MGGDGEDQVIGLLPYFTTMCHINEPKTILNDDKTVEWDWKNRMEFYISSFLKSIHFGLHFRVLICASYRDKLGSGMI